MVTEFAYPVLGGVSEHVHFLSRELVARGHDVTVVTGRAASMAHVVDIDRHHALEDGYRTVRVGHSIPVPINGSVGRVTLGPRVRERLRTAIHGQDVVHAQGLVGIVLPLLAVQESRAPVTVGTFHTYTPNGEYWAYKTFRGNLTRRLNKLDRRIAVSQACVQGLQPHFGGTWDVIPNGVDCRRFHPLAPADPRPVGPARILFVARLESRNRLSDLIEALALLRDRGRDVIVQVAGEGPTRTHDERLARRLGVLDRIQWLGLIHDDLPRRDREATVLAAPCTLASFGVILIESMASGTPVVCADNLGFRQVIRDGMPGVFVRPADPVSLAAGLERVLDDPQYGRDAVTHGRPLTIERYDWAGVAARVNDVYLEVLAGRSVRTAPVPV
jgi:glycosyltransferase involved in cell wall biosynthesis